MSDQSKKPKAAPVKVSFTMDLVMGEEEFRSMLNKRSWTRCRGPMKTENVATVQAQPRTQDSEVPRATVRPEVRTNYFARPRAWSPIRPP